MAFALTSQAAFAAQPTVLAPSSQWNLHYADDSCQLARQFGQEGAKVTVLLDQYAPGNSYDISISGEPTVKLAKGTERARVGFGPGLPLTAKDYLMSGTSGTNEHMIIVGRLDLLNRTGEDADKPTSRDDVARVRELHVLKGSNGFVLQLGPITDALKAMATCTADLVKLWGLDPVQQSNLASYPVPATYPGTWVRDSDYPHMSLRKREQGLVNFRLLVDAEGKPTVCRIQTGTRTPELRALTCDLIMKRAKFKPARDQNGTAVASYYIDSVTYVIE